MRTYSGLWGPAAPVGPVVAPLVPRCALLPAPTPRMRTRFARCLMIACDGHSTISESEKCRPGEAPSCGGPARLPRPGLPTGRKDQGLNHYRYCARGGDERADVDVVELT